MHAGVTPAGWMEPPASCVLLYALLARLAARRFIALPRRVLASSLQAQQAVCVRACVCECVVTGGCRPGQRKVACH